MAIKNADKLELWQRRLEHNKTEYSSEIDLMDGREDLYKGTNEISNAHTGTTTKVLTATHVRNIVAELIEAQVDNNIPPPKVTARRKKDEQLAKLIEEMLRNEIDRLRIEEFNDMMERTVPIQGGGFFLVEWDNKKRTHTTVGDVVVSTIHPKQVIPQNGVYSSIEDMDYIILRIPQTKHYIKMRYGVDVKDEGEEAPEVRGLDGEATADDMVTQNIAYYRNESGGIGIYSWVNDVALEDIEDYQSRRLRRCAKCGAVEPAGVEPIMNPEGQIMPTQDGTFPVKESEQAGKPKRESDVCPYCGSRKWTESKEDYEEIIDPKQLPNGNVIPGAQIRFNPDGTSFAEPTRIPYYVPDIYPVIIQKNVSVFGRFLGDSDVDKLKYQQNTINRISTSINDKLLKGGSYVTMPPDCTIATNDEDGKIIRLKSAADASLIHPIDLNMDVEQDVAYMENVYNQAYQAIGITEAYLGRRDATATSGKAKEFSASQAAGRLESKRLMKRAAYAALYEAIFKFKLAYTDETRPVFSQTLQGDPAYTEFDRYMFLEQDENGEWYWNDNFLFTCDTSAALATNREALWQEARMNFQQGAYGSPSDPQALEIFWRTMENYHYPGASEVRKMMQEYTIEKQRQAQEQMAMQLKMQQAASQQRQQEKSADRQYEAQQNQKNQEAQIVMQAQKDARADAQAQAQMQANAAQQ